MSRLIPAEAPPGTVLAATRNGREIPAVRFQVLVPNGQAADTLDGSTFRPGPMVDVTATRWM